MVKRKGFMSFVGRTIQFIAVVTCLGLLLFSAIARGTEQMESNYLYERRDYQTKTVALQPQTHKLGGLFGGYSNISIFPVTQHNAVGTNDIGKGITIISFPKGKIDYDRYFRNVDDIQGSGKYLPPISPDLIGFGQVRVFHLFDFKTKIYRKYRIVFPVTQYIENIAIADANRKHFIFQIESQKENAIAAYDVDNSLQLIDLSNDKPKIIKEIDIGRNIWTTTKDRLFIYKHQTKYFKVLDMNLEPAHHPLDDIVRQYKDKLDFFIIYIHPYYPFAIFEGSKGSVYVSWSKSKNTTTHLISEDCGDYSFSPDGKWVIYRTSNIGQTSHTYIMPVSEKYPHYLGTPILLSNKSFETGFGAWTTNPTGYAGVYLDEIYHWDLENRDFPEKGKMSFHDYIVREDLKKLTREKRQGLGK